MKYLPKEDICVSEQGEIFTSEGSALTWHMDSYGYCIVKRHGRRYKLHRLVAKAYLPDYSEDLTVNHKDGDKKNNSLLNLEMLSFSDNLRHAWDTGLKNADYLRKPVQAYSEQGFGHWFPFMSAVEKSGFSQPCVSRVVSGKNKTHKGFTWS